MNRHAAQFSKSAALVGIATLFAAFISYAFNPIYIAPKLGLAGVGQLGTFIYLTQIFCFPHRPLATTLTRYFSQLSALNKTDGFHTLLKQSTRGVTLVGILLLAILAILSPIISQFLKLPSPSLVLLASLFAFGGLYQTISQSAFQGALRFKGYALILLTDPIMRLLCGLCLFSLFHNVSAIIAAYIIGNVLSSALAYVFLKNRSGHAMDQVVSKNELLNYSLPVWAYSFFLSFALSVDVLAVKHFFDDHTTGLYVAASTLAKLPLIMVIPINSVAFPMLSHADSSNRPASSIFIRAITLTILITASASMAFFIYPSAIVAVTYGTDFSQAEAYLLPAFFSFIPLIFIICFSSMYFAQKKSAFTIGLLIGMVVHFTLLAMSHASTHQIIRANLWGGLSELALCLLLGSNIVSKTKRKGMKVG